MRINEGHIILLRRVLCAKIQGNRRIVSPNLRCKDARMIARLGEDDSPDRVHGADLSDGYVYCLVVKFLELLNVIIVL